jgi:hypothetical protein
MIEALGRLTVARKAGSEVLHANGHNLPFTVSSFWQWSASDLVSNATRGRLAEFIVATALGVDLSGVRDEWAAFDLTLPSGLKIEVKSAAYVQSWHQSQLSAITFDTRLTRGWDPATNKQSRESRRHADVYVFALLAHQDKNSIDPLDVSQWRFYAVPTSVLDARKRSQHSITLRSLEALAGPGGGYSGLADDVAGAAARQRATIGTHAASALGTS